jgi:predicted amidohydrolase YtcJ
MLQIKALEPDLIAVHGRVYTLDKTNHEYQAVAIKDGRFLALGNDDEIQSMAGKNTQRIDLEGRAVIPGIMDSHNHLWEVGEKLSQIRLDECTSVEEMMELLRAQVKITPAGKWILGMGWNEGIFTEVRYPTRHDIDKITTQHPVILKRFFNMDVVNTRVLQMAGIDASTPDPQGGKIERDADGTPNGILRASAKLFGRKLVPQPTENEIAEALKLAIPIMHKLGITSIIDPGLKSYEIRGYQTLYQAGGLNMRMNLMPSWHGFKDEEDSEQLDYRANELGIFSGLGDEWLKIGGLKMAIDGGTTSHTAYMYEPFIGETEVHDYNRLNPDDLYRFFKRAQELNWDIGIHTIGDRAQDMAVEQLDKVIKEIPRPDARHNIIHAYFPTEYALQKMAENHIAAVLQPTFIYYEGEMLFTDVGEQRTHHYKPARSYLDHHVMITSSSDVESTVSANPFPALYSLVARKNRQGIAIGPKEAITREEALRAYTINGTWLTREEHLKGSIELNKLADMVVLDRDYFEVPEEDIPTIKVDLTILDGKIVWNRNSLK